MDDNKKQNFFSSPKKPTTKINFGLVLVLWQLISENYGFVLGSGAQVVGANLVPILIYGTGIWLLYSGIKNYKRENK
ncbi:MAG: hypothetical protein AAB920_00215 [Patescibacteria group bacterium]